MEYRKDIDALKGIAIIAVVLFHMGLLKSGYLGVDIFFVINGYLIIPGILRKINNGEFKFFPFIEKRILRLQPLLVLASIVSLILGAFLMLPDNYENLAESVVASNLFSENILSAVTTKNYWNAVNDFKPLMHLWFVGILFEFYLLFPLIMILFRLILNKLNKAKDNFINAAIQLVASLGILSLILYLLPWFSSSDKFYYIQHRFYEFCIGGVVGLSIENVLSNKTNSKLYWTSVYLLLFILLSSLLIFRLDSIGNPLPVIGSKNSESDLNLIASQSTLLLLTVTLSAIVISQSNQRSYILNNTIIVGIGKRSYSIFIWHQVFLAFYRYSISTNVTIPFVLCYLVFVGVFSEISYRLIESKIKVSHKSFFTWAALAVVTIIVSFAIYMHAGVIRDVPEQNILFHRAQRGMHARYNDRIYEFDKDFPDNKEKINVLVEGVSFGRDFANCLIESEYSNKVNLSYVYKWDDKYLDRVKQADYIFSFTSKSGVPAFVWKYKKDSAEVWGIGTKNFGKSNGIIYAHRFTKDYFSTTIDPDPRYVDLNNRWRSEWGDNYIDFMRLAEMPDGKIRVFTPNRKFISQDCEHLTKEGAQWYATVIDWDTIFHNPT